MTGQDHKRRSHHAGSTCPHPKPLFSNGRERKFCFDCAPKPESRPRKPYQLRDAAERACARIGCGRSFAPKARQQRFCSPDCHNSYNNESRYQRVRAAMGRECHWCKAPYVPEVGLRQKHYCAEECRLAAFRASRSDCTHRRRAKKFGCLYEPVSKRKVFERDGWRCQLCGISTPAAKQGTQDADAPELDHIVPLSKGGEHSYRNTQCACRQCNGAKSDKPIEEIAALLARTARTPRECNATTAEDDLPEGGVRHPD